MNPEKMKFMEQEAKLFAERVAEGLERTNKKGQQTNKELKTAEAVNGEEEK